MLITPGVITKFTILVTQCVTPIPENEVAIHDVHCNKEGTGQHVLFSIS